MSEAMSAPDPENLLKEYLAGSNILIVDAASSVRLSLAASLVKLGCSREKMSLVASIEEARAEISRANYKMIFSDFKISSEQALELIPKEAAKDSIFVMVTGNASQSAVARAAEEEVDSFLVRPFAFEALKKTLMQTVRTKLNPNRYLELIDIGKNNLVQGKYDDAIRNFADAMLEHNQPTLACFYYGQAEFMKSALTAAEKKFNEGLSYNKIHFKCLTGLYELLSKQQKHHEAYDVMKRLIQYFPANPKRLASVLRLAIITENFQDIEGYFKIYSKLDHRPEELVRYMTSAFLVGGKNSLQQKNKARALEFFELALSTGSNRSQFFLYIIESLMGAKFIKDAENFLNRMGEAAPGSNEFKAANFLIQSTTMPVLDAIYLGRKIVDEGVIAPSVHEQLIQLALQGGYREMAFEFCEDAQERWPDKKERFVIVSTNASV